MNRVAGLTPQQLAMLIEEEIRVISENPYEFEDDDEEQLRDLMPHEVKGRRGVLATQPHDAQVSAWRWAAGRQ